MILTFLIILDVIYYLFTEKHLFKGYETLFIDVYVPLILESVAEFLLIIIYIFSFMAKGVTK